VAETGSLDFQVRPFVRADAPQVVAAIDSVCAEGPYLLTDRYRPTPQWEAVLCQEETADALLLVPVVRGQVAGWCRVFAGPSKSAHVGDVGIGLCAPLRGQGIGTALLQAAIVRARGTAFAKLTADIFGTNARARALFETCGFVQTGVRRRQYRIAGRDVDQVLLERFL
jgi:RimJ/RimL family protein N-acetyltransferase